MSSASLARVLHSCHTKQQQWAASLGMSPADVLLAALTMIALVVFICAA